METHLYLIPILGLVISFVLLWVFLQMAFAAWGSKGAKEKWIAMVNTTYFQLIGVKWISAFLVGAAVVQIVLTILALGFSIYTGKQMITR